MIDQRFEHKEKQRYYRIMLSQDLFGDWVITKVWGGIGKAGGRIVHVSYSSYEEAAVEIENILKIRRRRGYELYQENTQLYGVLN